MRYVLPSVCCYSEVENLGFDPHNIKSNREDIENFLQKLCQIENEARTNVRNNLKRVHENCMEVANKKRRLIDAKRHLWTEEQVEDEEERWRKSKREERHTMQP